MDEFTDEQLDRLRDAARRISGNTKLRLCDEFTMEELFEELRKKPVTFREGEVYACRMFTSLLWEYCVVGTDLPDKYPELRRPLRLSEQSQALEDFVKGVVKAKSDIEEWLKSEDDSLDMYEIFKALSALEIPR